MNQDTTGSKIADYVKDRLGRVVLGPLSEIVDDNISDIVTTIGSFVIKSFRGKFTRTISFTVGRHGDDYWMEDSLYKILYRYNKIKKGSNLKLENTLDRGNATTYYKLDNGTHNLKYRNYNILLVVQSRSKTPSRFGSTVETEYTLITYDLKANFITDFEHDMLMYRNSIMRIDSNSPTVDVWLSEYDDDSVWWRKGIGINKRRISTVYLPSDTKKTIVNTMNSFLRSKDTYTRHGIPHNLKIILHGPPGPQPHSIMIPTPNGTMRFGDLQIGDKVFDFHGHPTKILEIYERGNLDVFEVEFTYGEKVLCGESHMWPILLHNGKHMERSIKGMMEDGVIDANGNYRFRILQTEKEMEDNPPLMVKFIKYLGYKEKMRCIHVEHDMHIYRTTGWVPTCNCGKDTIAKMIASEWNRTIYYITGGKTGIGIPRAIAAHMENMVAPLFIISDIDKYPYLIDDTSVDLDSSIDERHKLVYKQAFGSMINALDGVASGEDKIIIMTTNHIEKFSSVFTRPGRVDLILEIGYVTPEVFRKYVYDMYQTVLPNDITLKRDDLTIADMQFDILFGKMTVDEFTSKYCK